MFEPDRGRAGLRVAGPRRNFLSDGGLGGLCETQDRSGFQDSRLPGWLNRPGPRKLLGLELALLLVDPLLGRDEQLFEETDLPFLAFWERHDRRRPSPRHLMLIARDRTCRPWT